MRSIFLSARVGKLIYAVCGVTLLASCTEAPPKLSHSYTTLPNRVVPTCLEDTILQYTDLSGNEPFPVSGYGLVTHLHGTGGSRAPTPVRSFMIKELARHDFGSVASDLPSPEQMLASKDVAIVRVDGSIPPGARSGTDWSTWFDVRVSLLPDGDSTSLAHGTLYQTDLKIGGANPSDPGNGMVSIKAQAAGAVFVNPNYVLDSSDESPAARLSRKTGVVLAGARALEDRPLLLRLRSPGRRLARGIEQRIIERFADVVDDDLRSASGNDAASSKKVANAKDEAVVYVYVPRIYTGDWEHFAGVVRHLYMKGGDEQYAALKSRELADEAVKAGAPLQDISYCWEGLGKPALFAMGPLLSSDQPGVQFAAARAAAFLQDPAAVTVLLSIANTKDNPFRVNAVRVLADLPATPRVDRLCRILLDSDEALVRIEAYKLLARHGDQSVYSRWIKDGKREVFAMDLIQSSGAPMITASQSGIPRIAIFGNLTQLEKPMMFSSMDQRLTISSEASNSPVDVFYRGTELKKPVSFRTGPSLPELITQLAGDREAGFSGCHFSYGDIVGIVQSLVDQHQITGLAGEQRLLASFVLQESAKVLQSPDARPLLRDTGGRPQSDIPKPDEKPADDHVLRPEPVDPLAPAVNAAVVK